MLRIAGPGSCGAALAKTSRLADQGRKAVITAVCGQENKADMGFTLEAMRLPLEAPGYEIVGELFNWQK